MGFDIYYSEIHSNGQTATDVHPRKKRVLHQLEVKKSDAGSDCKNMQKPTFGARTFRRMLPGNKYLGCRVIDRFPSSQDYASRPCERLGARTRDFRESKTNGRCLSLGRENIPGCGDCRVAVHGNGNIRKPNERGRGERLVGA